MNRKETLSDEDIKRLQKVYQRPVAGRVIDAIIAFEETRIYAQKAEESEEAETPEVAKDVNGIPEDETLR